MFMCVIPLFSCIRLSQCVTLPLPGPPGIDMKLDIRSTVSRWEREYNVKEKLKYECDLKFCLSGLPGYFLEVYF